MDAGINGVEGWNVDIWNAYGLDHEAVVLGVSEFTVVEAQGLQEVEDDCI